MKIQSGRIRKVHDKTGDNIGIVSVFGFLSILFLTSTIVSCDPGYTKAYHVDNKTKYEFSVNYLRYEEDSLMIISPNTKSTFYIFVGLGSAHDGGESFLSVFDTLIIKPVKEDILLSKDYYQRENWDFNLDKKRARVMDGGDADYSFFIDESDIINENEWKGMLLIEDKGLEIRQVEQSDSVDIFNAIDSQRVYF